VKASELAGLIGRKGSVRMDGGLSVDVEVRDARTRFGIMDYLIAPLAGGGEAWVEARRVELEEGAQ
jgi:hypothetical protein